MFQQYKIFSNLKIWRFFLITNYRIRHTAWHEEKGYYTFKFFEIYFCIRRQILKG